MNLEQVKSWIKLGESETLELKRSTGERKGAAKTICAMLNTRGGRVLIGVEMNGRIVGQDVSDHTIEEIAQEIKLIEPPVFPTIDRVIVDDRRELIAITISVGNGRPYAYKGASFIRVGNTNQPMSRDEYNRILIEKVHAERRWENEVAVGWTLDDLDHELIINTLTDAIILKRIEDPKTRNPMDILRGFKLIKDEKILNAAAVLFGKREKIGECWTQMLLKVASFRGTDKDEFIDNRQFEGNAFYLFQMANRFFMETIPIASKITDKSMIREDKPLYPTVAYREAIANAICHRDYSIASGSISVAKYTDRLEVVSTGTLHFGLTPEALYVPHESMPWNPLIAKVFYLKGIIETWGRGTLKMLEVSEEAGLSRPIIFERTGSVVVTFTAPVEKEPPAPEENLQDRILQLLRQSKKGLAIREIESRLEGIPRRKIKYELSKLSESGLANFSGKGAGVIWKVV